MKTSPVVALISLHEYMAAILDASQRATAEMIKTPSNPPSGRGSDRATVRVSA